ncbi:MAG: hypothetical protein Q8N94_03100 [Methanoregula sp.]|nr:hypothetical protein [Methanoregula sp.]
MPPKKLTFDTLMEIADDTQCRQCLRHLAGSSPEIAKKITKCLEKRVRLVDRKAVAADLYSDLRSLDVEELRAHSGKMRDRYVDVYEKAYEMFHELVEPGIDEMKRMQELSLFEEACEYCKGIMQGIADYNSSGSEFSDWITDVPEDVISETFDTWKEGDKSSPDEQAEVETLCQVLIRQ